MSSNRSYRLVLLTLLVMPFMVITKLSAFSITAKQSFSVADGKQGVEILIEGLNQDEVKRLKWNVPKSSLSKIKFISQKLSFCFFQASKNQKAKGEIDLQAKFKEKTSSTKISFFPRATLTFSKRKITQNEKTLITAITPDNYPNVEFFLGFSQGSVEEGDDTDSWIYTPSKTAYPQKIWVTLHYRAKPDLVLAKDTLEVGITGNYSVQSEQGVKLYLEMDGHKLGPYKSIDDLKSTPIKPGIESVTITAEDEAGNQSKITKKVFQPPVVNLVMAPNTNSLPLGGLSSRIRIINLGDPVDISQLSVKANRGLCSEIQQLSENQYAFVYTSPNTGKIGIDKISVSFKKRSLSNTSHIEMNLTAGVLSKTEMTPTNISKNDDGSLEMVYQLKLYDSNDNLIPEAEFVINSKLAKVKNITELDDGNYSFKILVPKDTNPEDLDLDLRLRPEFFDVLTSRILVYPPSSDKNNTVRVMVTNDEGLPLSDVSLIIDEVGVQKKELKTNALGMLNYTPKNLKLADKLLVGFKGFPQTNKEVIIGNKKVRKALNKQIVIETLTEKIEERIEEKSTKKSFDVKIKVPKKDGKIVTFSADLTPKSIIIKSQDKQLNADGKSKTTIDCIIMSKDGIPLSDLKIEARTNLGTISTIRSKGVNHSFVFTSEKLEKSTDAKIQISVKDTNISESLTIKLTIKSSDPTIAQTVTSETANAESITTTSDSNSAELENTNNDNQDPTTETKTEVVITSLNITSSKTEVQYPNNLEFTINLTSENNEKIPDGTEVSLSVDKGTIPSSAKSQNGKVTVTYTPDNSSSTAKITAKVGNISTSISITVKEDTNLAPAVPTKLTLSISPSEVIFPNTATLTATIIDQYNNPVADGTAVTINTNPSKGKINSGKTQGGSFSSTYAPEDEEYTITFNVTSETLSESTSLKVSPKPLIAIDSIAWDSAEYSTTYPNKINISLSVKGSDGNPILDGTSITLSADQGALSSTSAKTQGGKASIEFTPTTNENSTSTISASAEGKSASTKVTVSKDVSLEPAVPTTMTVSLSKEEIIFPEKVTVSISVQDQYGNPVPDDTEVTLTASKGEIAGGKTKSGSLTAEYTPVDESYDISFDASTGTLQESSSTLMVKQAPYVAEVKFIKPTDGSAFTGEQNVVIELEVLDQYGTAAESGEVSIKLSGSGKLSSETLTVAGGKASATYTSVDESYDASLEAVAIDSQDSITLTFKQTPKCAKIEAKSDKTSLTYPEEASIELSISDQYGEAITDGTEVTISAPSKGKLSATKVKTSGGKAKVTYTSVDENYDAEMNFSIIDCDDSASITISVTEEEKPPVSINEKTTLPKEIKVDSEIEISFEVTDKNKNPVKDGYTVDFKSSSGSFSPQSTKTSSGLVKTVWTPAKISGDSVTLEAKSGDATWNDSIKTLAGQPNKTNSSLSISALSSSKPSLRLKSFLSTVGSGDSFTITAEIQDKFKNLVIGERIEFKAITDGAALGSFDKEFDITDSNGLASVKFSGGSSGNITFEAWPADFPTEKVVSQDSLVFSNPAPVNTEPTSPDLFELSSPTQLTIDNSLSLTITAKTNAGETVSKYTGLKSLIFTGASSFNGKNPTVTVGSNPTQFGNSVNVNFTNGVATVTLNFIKTESVNLNVTDGTVSNSNYILTVDPGSLNKFNIQTIKINNSVGIHLLITAYDQFENAISLYNPLNNLNASLASGTQSGQNITWSDLPTGMTDNKDGTATLNAATFSTFNSKGQLIIGINNTLAETNTFSISTGSITSISNSFTWSPGAASVLFYGVEPASSITQNSNLSDFSVIVRDQFGNIASTDNSRQITLTILSGSSVFTNNTATTQNGVATFSSVSYPITEQVTFQATSNGLLSTPQRTLIVNGGSVSSFNISADKSSINAGDSVTYTVQALNSGGTTATNFAGSITISPSDTQATFPSTLTFTATDQGSKSFNGTYKTQGSHSITIAQGSITKSSSSLTVNSIKASALRFSSVPSTAIESKTISTVLVQIVDSFNNVISQSNTISLTLASGSGTLSGTTSVISTNGVATFSDLTYNTAEVITLTASAQGFNSITSPSINITSAGLFKFDIITPFTNLRPAEASLVNRIRALDANGDVITDYNGSITFTSSDNTATLPSTYQFQSFDQGVVDFTNQITFNTLGSHTFSVTDASASVTTQSSTFTISNTNSKPVKTSDLINNLTVYPKAFNPRVRNKNTVQINGIFKTQVSGSQIEILDGSQVIFSKSFNDKFNLVYYTWDGKNNNNQLISNGAYIVKLTVWTLDGSVQSHYDTVDIFSNIDIIHYGP